MPRQLTPENQTDIHFTELAAIISADTGGFQNDLDRSLRLPERNGGNMELKVHTERFNNPLTAKENSQNAARLIYDSLQREVGQHAADVLWGRNQMENGRVTVRQIKDLHDLVQNFHQAQAVIRGQMNDWGHRRQQNSMPLAAPSLDALTAAPVAQLKVSDQGSGGAILTPSGVAKVEHSAMGRGAYETAQVAAEAFGMNSPDCPLQFTPVALYTDPASLQAAHQALSAFKATPAGANNYLVDKHLQTLDPTSPKAGDAGVSVAARVDGRPLNRLKIEEKIALFQGGQLAADIGKASVLCPVLGLNDHVGPNGNGTVGPGFFAAGQQNISNLMLDNQTGRLVAIDYAPTAKGTITAQGVSNGYGSAGPDNAVASLAAFVTRAAESPEAYEEAVQQMLTRNGSVCPLAGTMTAFLKPDDANGDSYLSHEEKEVFDLHVTPEQQRAFAEQMLKGAVEGLSYLHEHQQELAQAVENSSQRCGMTEGYRRNFLQPQEMANLHVGLEGMEFAQLRANLAAVSQGQTAPKALQAPSFKAPSLYSLEVLAEQAMEGAGLKPHLDGFNAGNGYGLHITPEQMITPELKAKIEGKVKKALEEGKTADACTEARALLDEAMKGKMAAVQKVNARADVGANRPFAIEAALKNDYASPEAFENSYFRGKAAAEAKVGFIQNVDTSEIKLTSPSVDKALKSLAAQPAYDPAVPYNPAGYFAKAQAGIKSGQTDFQLNAAVLGTAMAAVPKEQEGTRQILAQRMAGYQMKFAPVNEADTLQTQVNPLQNKDKDTYVRSTGSELAGFLQGQLAGSLGVNAANIHPVTDSRFMEVLKRSRSLEENGAVVEWGKKQFKDIYAKIDNDADVFLDITPFMAGTLHGHETAEVAEAIQVANEFMHDAMEAGVDKYLDTKADYKGLDADGKAAAKQAFMLKMDRQLTMGAMLQVGEQHALYTAPLGHRTRDQRFHEGVTRDPEAVQHQIAHNGFTMGPQHLLDNWSRGAPTPEHMLGKLNLMTGGAMTKDISAVTLPEDTSELARFEKPEDFLNTQIFKDFKALGQEGSNAPPYVRVSTAATASMLEGMQEMQLHQSFGDQGLDPVLQMTYNRMQGAMQKAVAAADDPAKFNEYLSQIELVHEQLSNTLAVARPYKQEQFSEVMRQATNLMPDHFPEDIQPQFALKNSGLRALSSTLSGVEAQQNGRKLNIAMQKDCYYESGSAMQEAANHRHLTLDGDHLNTSTTDIAATLGGEKLDMFVAEFHHNISIDREEYHAEDVTAQVDRLFKEGLVSDQFTVALDTTIATTNAEEVKAFLDHNKDRIAEGKLNVVMYRSGQKFDLMGMDNYNGGVMAVVNNGQAFAKFNDAAAKGRGVDNLGDLSVQGFTLMQKHAQQPLNDYRRAAMKATAALGNPQSAENPLGMPPTMIIGETNRGAGMIQIARNTDDKAVFLDLRNPWLEKGSAPAVGFNNGVAGLLTKMSQENPADYHIEGRASFGFMHSNVTVIGGDKFRFNPGLEDDTTMARYRDTFVAMNDVLMQSKADYPAMEDFNAINCNLMGDQDGMATLVKQQMKVNAGQALTPEERLEAASILSAAGNKRGAARMLVSLSQEPNLTAAQTQAIATQSQALQGKLQTSPRPPSGGPKKDDLVVLHESAAQVRAMLRQGGDINSQDFLTKLGAAQEASLRLGQQGAEQRLTSLLASDFKNIPPAQLAAISRNAERIAANLPANDPQAALLQTTSKLAGQNLMISLAATDAGRQMTPQQLLQAADHGGLQSERQISEQFLAMANARQRPVGEADPTPRTTMGDIYATFEHYQDGVKEGADPGGDRIIALDGDAPEERLMGAIVGHGVEHMADMQMAFADPAVTDELKKIINEMPPEQRTMYTGSSVNAMYQVTERGLRSAQISYKEMLGNAQKEKPAKFAKAAAEFESKINNLMQESRFVGDLLTKPENLARLPAQYRDDLRKFGENSKAIGQELARPGGFGQSALNFASLATSKPELVMKQTCDVMLPTILKMPPAPLPPVDDQGEQVDPNQLGQNDVAEMQMPPMPNHPPPPPPLDDDELPKAGNQLGQDDLDGMQIPQPPNYPAPLPPGQNELPAYLNEQAPELPAYLNEQAPELPAYLNEQAPELPAYLNEQAPELPAYLNEQAPEPVRATLTEEQIDKAIAKYVKPKDLAGPDVREYKAMASDIHANLQPDRTKRMKPDTAAIEAQLIDRYEIMPLNEQIEAAEQALAELEQIEGISADDPRIEAQKAELNELYEDLDNWETRVDTLKASMKVDDRKNRLAGINAAHEADQAALANEPPAPPRVQMADDVKLHDGNPRQEYELQVSSAATARGLMNNVPSRGIDQETLKSRIGNAYGNAYTYEGPERLKEDGSKQRVKGANDRGINDAEKSRLAAEMQPTIDKVNEIQQTINALEQNEMTMMADFRAEIEADINNAPEETRQEIKQAEENLATAQARLDHVEDRLQALDKPGPLERAKATLQHGSVDKAREHYQKEKEAKTQLRNTAKSQLDQALDKAAVKSMRNTPEGQILADQIRAEKNEQNKALQKFAEIKEAHAASIKPERVKAPENNIKFQPGAQDAVVDVKSALKAGAHHETNAQTLANQAQRQQRDERLKPSVQDALKEHAPHHAEGQGQQAGEGSLRAKWTPAAKKPEMTRSASAPNLGRSKPGG